MLAPAMSRMTYSRISCKVKLLPPAPNSWPACRTAWGPKRLDRYGRSGVRPFHREPHSTKVFDWPGLFEVKAMPGHEVGIT